MANNTKKAMRMVKNSSTKGEERTAIGTELYLPNHSGDLSVGKILKTPVNDHDPVNKKYVDAQTPPTPTLQQVTDTGATTTTDIEVKNITYSDNTIYPKTSSTGKGIIYKDTDLFLYDFSYGDNGVVTPLGNNLFIGFNAGNLNIGSTATATFKASQNLGIGFDTLKSLTDGYRNVGIGPSVLDACTSGHNNVAIGHQALGNLTTGLYDVSIGTEALYRLKTGRGTTGIGYNAGHSANGYYNLYLGYQAGLGVNNQTTGHYNTMLGGKSGFATTTGSGNIFIGYQAGNSVTTGGYNIIIGYDDDTPTATTSNHLNIGGAIYGDLSTGNIGIGDTTPSYKLDVNGTMRSTGIITGDSDLTVAGNVGIGTTTPGQPLTVFKGSDGAAAFGIFGSNDDGVRLSGFAHDANNYAALYAYDENDGGSGSYTDLRLGNAVSNGLYFDNSAGNWGIGTTSPNAKLEINSDKFIISNSKTPSSASDTGVTGTICWDTNYMYVCTATNTWKRTALNSW